MPIGVAAAMNEFNLDLVSVFETLEKEARIKFNHIAVDLGAGVRDSDPVFPLYDRGWTGVMIDGDRKQRAKMTARFPSKHISKMIAIVEPDTAAELIEDGMKRALGNSTRQPDLLKIDIDSFDCSVIDALLYRFDFRPKFIVMEVNVKFPPSILFSLAKPAGAVDFDSERRGHFYGCSLAYQVRALLAPIGYRLVCLDYNNALYARRDVLLDMPHLFARHSIADWDRAGYYDRPERRRKFGFNEAVRDWRTSDSPVEAVLQVAHEPRWKSHTGIPFILGRASDVKTFRFNDHGIAEPVSNEHAGRIFLQAALVHGDHHHHLRENLPHG